MISKNSFPYALITGGSKGVGYAIAEALAQRKFNLILVGRNAEDLLIAKTKLQELYYIQVETLIQDISQRESAAEIALWCTSNKISLNMLCNVAGLGGDKDYLSLSIDSLRYMISLNIEASIALTHALLPMLENNTPSYILNVGSMAGFTPIPSKNIYSATKAAVLFFSYALHYQVKDKGVSVSCLVPGPVFTKPSIEADTKKKLGWLGIQMAVEPKKVGEIAVRETLNKKLIIIPGTLAKIMSMIMRTLPTRFVVWLYYKFSND